MRRAPFIGPVLLPAFAALVYVNSTSLLSARRAGKPVLLAHRGLHQTFHADGLEADTCGGIWTNRIDRLAPLARSGPQRPQGGPRPPD